MLTHTTCRHCGKPVACRAGRGLCRACWNKPAVRRLYGPVATFGGNVRTQIRVAREYRQSDDYRPALDSIQTGG